MAAFDRAFAVVVGEEGGFDDVRSDPGNWTGGCIGAGELRGTKFGISAAAYPALDIANLTLDDAKAIYLRDYWQPIGGGALDPALALVLFDAAVNNGRARAVRWLQGVIAAGVDGMFGPETLGAVDAYVGMHGVNALCAEFMAVRLNFMALLPTWRTFGLGWARRLCALPYQALTMTQQG